MSRLTYTVDMAIDDRTDIHPHVPEEHYCEHSSCTKWGSLGYSSGRSSDLRWWCAQHYPHWTEEERRRRGTLSA